MAVADHFDSVQKIYIAFYQRPADPAGLRYWADRVEVAGGDTGAVINAFAASEEATALYGEINNENIGDAVTKIYQALFGRAPDAAGLAYYEEAFEAGELTAGTIALSILDGARGDDTIAINNKLAVANEFTQQVDGRDFDDANFGQGGNTAVTYNADDVTAARAILAAVTAAPGTVLDANAVREALQEQIANEGDPIQNPGAGNTFTLTDAVGEVVTGTAGNDTIAAVAGGTEATLNTGDQINGAGGTDTLNIFVAEDATGLPSGASIRAVEVINLHQEDGLFAGSAAVIDASDFEGATAIWQIDDASGIENLADGQTAGFRGTVAAAVAYEDDVETALVALDNADAGSSITVTGDDLNTVSVSGSLASAGAGAARVLTLNIDGAGGEAGIETINLALTTATTLNIDAGFNDVLTLDASASTGAITANMSVATEEIDLESVVGGSGADNLTIAIDRFSAEEVTIEGGAGNDVLTVDAAAGAEATALTINFGAGRDTLNLDNLGNIVDAEDFVESIISVQDFNGTQDYISLDAGTLVELDNIQAGDFETALEGGLTSALDYLATQLDAGQATAFQFEGNTYIYESATAAAATAEFGAGDGLVELVGFTGAFTSANSDFAAA